MHVCGGTRVKWVNYQFYPLQSLCVSRHHYECFTDPVFFQMNMGLLGIKLVSNWGIPILGEFLQNLFKIVSCTHFHEITGEVVS